MAAPIEENATGIIDGVNDTFETVTSPYAAGSLRAFLNGQSDRAIQELGGKRFRFTVEVPEPGDTVSVHYLGT